MSEIRKSIVLDEILFAQKRTYEWDFQEKVHIQKQIQLEGNHFKRFLQAQSSHYAALRNLGEGSCPVAQQALTWASLLLLSPLQC